MVLTIIANLQYSVLRLDFTSPYLENANIKHVQYWVSGIPEDSHERSEWIVTWES